MKIIFQHLIQKGMNYSALKDLVEFVLTSVGIVMFVFAFCFGTIQVIKWFVKLINSLLKRFL